MERSRHGCGQQVRRGVPAELCSQCPQSKNLVVKWQSKPTALFRQSIF